MYVIIINKNDITTTRAKRDGTASINPLDKGGNVELRINDAITKKAAKAEAIASTTMAALQFS